VVDAGGPYEGFIGYPINFTGTVVGGVPPYNYYWEFGDGNSSTQQNPTHIYIFAGNYTVALTVTDDSGDISIDDTWAKIEGSNNPPSTPNITGPASAKPRVEIEYTFSTEDPELNNVFYFIEWGDGTNSSWVGPFVSGEEIKIKHKWSTKNVYTIKCKAKDTIGAESNWGTFEVTIPRYKFIGNTFISRFLERFFKNVYSF